MSCQEYLWSIMSEVHLTVLHEWQGTWNFHIWHLPLQVYRHTLRSKGPIYPYYEGIKISIIEQYWLLIRRAGLSAVTAISTPSLSRFISWFLSYLVVIDFLPFNHSELQLLLTGHCTSWQAENREMVLLCLHMQSVPNAHLMSILKQNNWQLQFVHA